MKIVQFMASAGYGGAEKVFVELANGLSANHEVVALVVRNCTFQHRFDDRVKIVELKSNPTSNNPLLHLELFKILKNIKPDIIHTHAAKGSMLVHRVNRFLKLNHLATKHNDRKGRIFNSLAHVSCVSEKVEDSVISAVNGEKRVIYNGIVEKEVSRGDGNDEFTMLAIGRLDALKGFDYLIREVAKLDFPFQLNIIGEGPEQDNLLGLINEHGLADKVHLLGFREDIPQLMCDSDLVIISSLKEGGPRVLVEALSYAPMLISTKVGVVPEVLPVKFQTSLESLSSDINTVHSNYDKMAEEFSVLKKEKRGAFALSGIVKQYEKYYEDIVKD